MYNCSASDYFTSYFVKLIACSLTGQSALHVWLRFCRIVATINYLSSISLFQAGKRKKEREIPDTKFMRIQLTGNLFLRWNASTHAEAVLDSLTSQDNKTYPLPTKKDPQVSLGSHFPIFSSRSKKSALWYVSLHKVIVVELGTGSHLSVKRWTTSRLRIELTWPLGLLWYDWVSSDIWTLSCNCKLFLFLWWIPLLLQCNFQRFWETLEKYRHISFMNFTNTERHFFYYA